MKYTQTNSNPFSSTAPTGGVPSVFVPPITGALVGPSSGQLTFRPWQPSTWPTAPPKVNANFVADLRKIFQESILDEIENVIEDAKKRNGDLQHRGHVVAIALMCALDAISAYGYRGRGRWKRGKHIEDFVTNHFPRPYRRYAQDMCQLYRNSLIHSWNLFEAAILPGNEKVRKVGLTLEFGLLNFFSALRRATNNYLKKLQTDANLQRKTLERYSLLRQTARP